MAGDKKKLSIDTLWKLQRLGAPSLSPDGAQAVCAVASPSMKDNRTRSTLWLLSTLGGQPRALTHCGSEGAPAQSDQAGGGDAGNAGERDHAGGVNGILHGAPVCRDDQADNAAGQ